MKLLLVNLFILISSLVIGQIKMRKELDSLKKSIRQSSYYDSTSVFLNGQKAITIAKKLKDPNEIATVYQYYGNFYYFSSNIKKAKENYFKSIEIAEKNKNSKLVNSTKIRLAFVLTDTDLIAAEKEFKFLLNDALKNKYIENTIEIYNGLGNLYDSRLMHDEALKFYLKGLSLADKSNKKYLHGMMLNNIGLIKLNNGQTKEAEKDFTEALKIIEGLNEDRLSFNLNNNLGLVNKKLKDYKESIKYYKNTLNNAKELGFPLGRGVSYLNLSDSYINNKDFLLADKYADSAMTLLKTFQQWNYVGMSYLIKATIFYEMGQLDTSKKYIDSVFLLNKSHSMASNVMNGHFQLKQIYEKQKDFKLAFFNSNRYHEMSDSISEIANKDKLSQLQLIYNKEKVVTELENEKSKNTILSKENELKKTRMKATLVISLFILIIGIGIIYIRHVRLTRKNQQQFTQKLIDSIDVERSRISKDLHDDIGQSLSAIKSKLNLLNTGKINDVIGLDKEVGEVINSTRNISHFLHPSIIQKLGLERSLISLTEKTQDNTGIVCSLDIINLPETLSLNSETQIYRIMQECINNTIKHGKAGALKISIKDQSGNLHIQYQDNGKGIDESHKKNDGIGMLTIQERANSLNGKITISSIKNKGFKLVLLISNKI